MVNSKLVHDIKINNLGTWSFVMAFDSRELGTITIR